MRVRVASLTVVAPDARQRQRAERDRPRQQRHLLRRDHRRRRGRSASRASTAGPAAARAPCCVPRFDGNPERLRVDSDGQVGAPVEVTTGARCHRPVGPLDFGFRTYTILPDPAARPGVSGNVPAPRRCRRRRPTSSPSRRSTSQRFFDTVNDPASATPVLTPAAFENRLNKASLMIRNVLRSPDILGVEEVENLATLQALAADASTPTPSPPASPIRGYRRLPRRGQRHRRHRRRASWSRPRASTWSRSTQEGKDATYIDPQHGEPATLLNDRPPLVLQRERAARRPAAPLPVTVIVNHLRSLTGIDDPARRRARARQAPGAGGVPGRPDPGPPGRRSDGAHRVRSATSTPSSSTTATWTSIGTHQGHAGRRDQVVLASADLVNPDLVNLVDRSAPAERYSFVFDGNAQALDHVLVNQPALATLRASASRAATPTSRSRARNDATRPERISDHDIPVAYFQIMPDDVTASTDTLSTPFLRIPFTNRYLGVVLVQNDTPSPIAGPIHVVFDNLTPGVTITNATGTLLGSPYITVPINTFRRNQILAVPVLVTKPANLPINYTLRIEARAFDTWFYWGLPTHGRPARGSSSRGSSRLAQNV